MNIMDFLGFSKKRAATQQNTNTATATAAAAEPDHFTDKYQRNDNESRIWETFDDEPIDLEDLEKLSIEELYSLYGRVMEREARRAAEEDSRKENEENSSL